MNMVEDSGGFSLLIQRISAKEKKRHNRVSLVMENPLKETK